MTLTSHLPWRAALLATCALSACAPRSSLKTAHLTAPVSVTHLAVPFFPDNTDQCGPSVLASILKYWRIDVTPAELRSTVYVKRLKGTFPMDMAPALRSHGLETKVVSGSFELIRSEIDAGRPAIAYLDFGTLRHPIGHYVVITGYDQKRKGLYVHSALNKDKFSSYRRFDRGWKDTDHWLLLASSAPFAVQGVAGDTRTPVRRGIMASREHVELASIYSAKGLLADAKAQYEMALKADPKSVDALSALGTYELQAGHLREAETYLRRALKIDPDHPAANNNLAMAYVSEDRHLAQAERLALKATKTALAPYAYDTLASIYRKTGQLEAARQAYANAAAHTDDPVLQQSFKQQQATLDASSN